MVKHNSYNSLLEDHTKTILKNLTLVPKYGTPGFVMAYGDKVYPQVISTESNILLCAAEHKAGRIVVATHSSYANGLKDGSVPELLSLQKNVIQWLSKGSLSDTTSSYENHVVEITDDSSVSHINHQTKVIFWAHGEAHLSSESQDTMTEFVLNGGGLFYAFTPWAYLVYVNKEVPMHGMFKQLGMTFSDDYDVLYGSDDGFTINLDEDHFRKAIANNLHEYSKENIEFLQSDALVKHQKYLMTMISHSNDFRPQMLKVYNDNSSLLQIPTKDNPVRSNTAKSMLVLSDLLSRYGVPGMGVCPGAAHFPGIAVSPANADQSSPFVLPQCQGNLHSSGRTVELGLMSFTRDIFPTGCYANPGQEVKVQVLSGSGQGWKVKVGAHTDFLNPQHQSELRRYFDVHVHKELTGVITKVVSPYGGIIQFESPDTEEKNTLKVHLENVLMTPYFDLKDDLCKLKWNEVKHYPGVWADMAGEYFMVTLPRSSIQGVTEPDKVMAKWDRIIRLMHFLRGTEVRTHRKQWLVTDEQPSTGYLHMGYPIVSHLDIANPSHGSFILSGNWSSFWGIYHEIGHNLQRNAWTFEGSVEVTCNIFSMYCMQHVTGDSPLHCEWVQLQLPGIQDALLSGNYSFDTWKANPGIAIGIYAQLCEHLGWGCMCHVLRHYEAMAETKPQSDKEKIDHWFVTYSKSAQLNLAPLFVDFWEWPVSEASKQEVAEKQYVDWLPEDDITSMDPSRVNKVKEKYPNMERKVAKRKYPYIFESSSTILSVN